MAQAVGRHMIQRGIRGAIVMTSSTCAMLAMGRGNFAYSISKADVNHLTCELALEWGFFGIRVNAVEPCQVDAPSMDDLLSRDDPSGTGLRQRVLGGIPLGRLATADDMAGPVGVPGVGRRGHGHRDVPAGRRGQPRVQRRLIHPPPS